MSNWSCDRWWRLKIAPMNLFRLISHTNSSFSCSKQKPCINNVAKMWHYFIFVFFYVSGVVAPNEFVILKLVLVFKISSCQDSTVVIIVENIKNWIKIRMKAKPQGYRFCKRHNDCSNLDRITTRNIGCKTGSGTGRRKRATQQDLTVDVSVPDVP